jgi:hypothetical protein
MFACWGPPASHPLDGAHESHKLLHLKLEGDFASTGGIPVEGVGVTQMGRVA